MNWGTLTTLASGATSLYTSYAASAESPKIDLEPLSTVINFWLRVFLPPRTKPAISNYHITWDLPKPVASFDLQGTLRWASSNITDHILIIGVWEKTVKSALNLHFPIHTAEDPIMVEIFKGAIKGLQLIKNMYPLIPKTDTSADEIDKCVKHIARAITKADTEEGFKIDRKVLPLSEETKNLWAKRHYIETIYANFIDILKIPEAERETNGGINFKVNAIIGLTEERSYEFGLLINQRIY